MSNRLPDLSTFLQLRQHLTSTRSGDSVFSSLDIIELYLLGKVTVEGRITPHLTPPTEINRGSLKEFLVHSKLFDPEFFYEIPDRSLTPCMALVPIDSGRNTRSGAPFLPPPAPHQYDKNGFMERLSHEERGLIARIRSQVNVSQVGNSLFLLSRL